MRGLHRSFPLAHCLLATWRNEFHEAHILVWDRYRQERHGIPPVFEPTRTPLERMELVARLGATGVLVERFADELASRRP